MAEIKKISTELQLLNKFLDTSGSAGSSGSVLTSTSTGTSWVSAGTPGTGVYLPLSAGSSYPLTDTLYLATASNLGKLQFGTANSDYYIRGGGNYGYININGPIVRFDTNASERMRITSTGNVGIGTTSPAAKLSLGDAVDAQKLLLYDAGNNYKYGFGIQSDELRQFFPSTSGARMVFGTISETDGSTFSEKMRIDSAGDVTIQTSGADDIKNFTINSSNGSSQVAGLIIQNDGANGYIHFKAGSGNAAPTTRLTIGNAANSGNVGIGTTNPTYPLDVAGTARATNFKPKFIFK